METTLTRTVPKFVVPAALLIMSLCAAANGATFSDDVSFLNKHTQVIVLRDQTGQAQLVVSPAWQGRVMTSTARGDQGDSFGWVNRDLIASGKVQPHINVYGGEDRFWLGPEGGQFSIFFAKGVSFDLEHWFTPAPLDTEPFQVLSQSSDHVVCQRTIHLTNYSGTSFSLEVKREVRLLSAAQGLGDFGFTLPPGVSVVAFESVNTVNNTGSQTWSRQTGLLSIWILGMFNASPETTVVLPFQPGPESARGAIVNDTYFGKVPADRLVVGKNVLFFRADAKFRSKKLAFRRAEPSQSWAATMPRIIR